MCGTRRSLHALRTEGNINDSGNQQFPVDGLKITPAVVRSLGRFPTSAGWSLDKNVQEHRKINGILLKDISGL
ncbi:hypothetical protein J6590_104734 [Homalodisca vitripennis]|nr:hypothetical protein J6590_104734 [Homalodisca vitripennis]